ncbi:CocE/NonD family hydrolase [Echinicola arenosa]|uniref:CocE/NonD family hydrolase n=1 Tax=Echinicola arenosa TaxID=2774144 RepID=UPI001CDC4A46|nr:CocE/NonD family hydrolase [Echinicola arenosa]
MKEIGLEHGSHTVGFTHYLASDSTRTYKRIFDWNNNTIPRPIPISIWYPSKATLKGTKPMQVLDYMEILKEEEEWEYLPNEQILNWFNYANTTANQNHLKEQTITYFGLQPENGENGKYPVIVYAPSYQASSIENFALCSFLASHGYIVLSSPSRGTENRFLEGGTEKDMETQARDIEFLIKEASLLSTADLGKIATIGFSFGGLSNVLSQMRNESIKAIVSLDGSIKYQYSTLKKSPFFDIKKVDIPFIHMAQKDIPEEVMKEHNINPTLNHQFEFYDSLVYSQAYQLKFNHLTHAYFSTLGVLFQERDKRQDKSDAEIMDSYRWVSIYTLKFLDASLKNNEDGFAFLENPPVQNGMIILKTKLAQQRPFDFQDFNELASKHDYKDLETLYEETLQKHPSMQLPEGNLNNLGLQLTFNPETSQYGISIFLLATHLYPNSANLYDSMAEAYLFIGDRDNAIVNFKKSLSLNPHNQNATARLKQLQE